MSISEDALELIKSQNFEKGNVRELKNIMENLIARLPSGRERIEMKDLNEVISGSLDNSSTGYSIYIPSRDFTSKEIAI